MLSYSPEQQVQGFVQWAVMPAIFAELAMQYRPADVSNPNSPVAAANGQYLLVSREAYQAVGGHDAVSSSLLEDVQLARLVKASGRGIFFRHGKGLVCTRMYRSTRQLVEGWTKNLALLFPRAIELALARAAEFIAIMCAVAVTGWAAAHRTELKSSIFTRESVMAIVGLGILAWLRVVKRVTAAHFGIRAQLVAPLGLPIFSYLLLRSHLYYRWRKSVTWKGRAYCPNIQSSSSSDQSASSKARSARSFI